MKIALFVHCFFPDHYFGTETYTLQVARNLQAMGHEPVVVTANFPGETVPAAAVTSYRYEGVPVYLIDKTGLPVRRIRDSYHDESMRPTLSQLLREIQPDVVHVTHLVNHTAVLLDVLVELGLPAVATLTDFFGFCYNNRLEAADESLCAGPSPSRTNCIACALKTLVERRSQGRFRSLGSHPLPTLGAAALRVVHPGRFLSQVVDDLVQRPTVLAPRYATYRAVIAPTRFLAAAYQANGLTVPLHHSQFGIDMAPVAKEPASPGSPLRLGFIGQLAPHKGPDLLIEAFRRLPPGKAGLHIFGSESQSPTYSHGLRRQAGDAVVHFRGTFPSARIAEIFAGLDVLVIPSRWHENSPLVLLAALASHTPVVAAHVEGMAEFIQPGSNGWLFERGSVDDLARVLGSVVADPAATRGLSASTRYERSTRQMTEEVVAIYESARGRR